MGNYHPCLWLRILVRSGSILSSLDLTICGDSNQSCRENVILLKIDEHGQWLPQVRYALTLTSIRIRPPIHSIGSFNVSHHEFTQHQIENPPNILNLRAYSLTTTTKHFTQMPNLMFEIHHLCTHHFTYGLPQGFKFHQHNQSLNI